MAELGAYTLGVFTVNRLYDTTHYHELEFVSLEAVKQFLTYKTAKELNLNTWATDFSWPAWRFPADRREVYVALDFVAGEHLVPETVPPEERQELIAAGWEV